jgi:hypothetical protein
VNRASAREWVVYLPHIGDDRCLRIDSVLKLIELKLAIFGFSPLCDRGRASSAICLRACRALQTVLLRR